MTYIMSNLFLGLVVTSVSVPEKNQVLLLMNIGGLHW